MKTLVNRAKYAINGENGGPSVETIVMIAVALIIGVALIAFGRRIVAWIGGAQESVDSMEIADLGAA